MNPLVPRNRRSERPAVVRRSKKPRLGQKIIDETLLSHGAKRAVMKRAVSPANMVPVVGGSSSSAAYVIASVTTTITIPFPTTTALSTSTNGARQGQIVAASSLTIWTRTLSASSSSQTTARTSSLTSSSRTSTSVSSIIRSVTSLTSFSRSSTSSSTSLSTSLSRSSSSSRPITTSLATSSSLSTSVTSFSTSSAIASATAALTAASSSSSSSSKSLAHNTPLLVTLILGSIIIAAVVLFGLAWLCRRSRKRSTLDVDTGLAEGEGDYLTQPWAPNRASIVPSEVDESKDDWTISRPYYDSYLAGAIPQMSMEVDNNRMSHYSISLAPPHRLKSPVLD